MQECKEKWTEKRVENCVSLNDQGRKRKYEKCDLDSYRLEEAFTQIFKKGKAEPIHDFLVNNGYDPASIGNPQKQLKFVQEDPWPFLNGTVT